MERRWLTFLLIVTFGIFITLLVIVLFFVTGRLQHAKGFFKRLPQTLGVKWSPSSIHKGRDAVPEGQLEGGTCGL